MATKRRRVDRRTRERRTRERRGTALQKFAVFYDNGSVAVRIGAMRTFMRVEEVVISAVPIFVTMLDGGLLLHGEGVARRHLNTVSVTA